MNKHRGILFIAFGERWIEEAKRSMHSVRCVSSLPIAVVTDRIWQDGAKPDYFVTQEKVNGWASKPLYMYSCSPFDQTLFIDTDTIVLSDPEPIFGLLDYYDVGVRFGGPMLSESPSLVFHTQCNSGVILYKKAPIVAECFANWNIFYVEACARLSESGDSRGLNDQRYLSLAIAKSMTRPVHLAEYLNFAIFETIYTYSPVVILHGRDKHLHAIGHAINRNWNPELDWQARLWLQNIKGILPRGIRRSDPLLAISLLFRRLKNELALRLYDLRRKSPKTRQEL
jgi:hypothetical protein